MNRLQSTQIEKLPSTSLDREISIVTNNTSQEDDDIFLTTTSVNDQQAHIRRRAPTRHSIKSLTSRKSLSKQNSTNEIDENNFVIFERLTEQD